MICVKLTAFCDLRADLRIGLATLRKSVRKFWFCKLESTCESVGQGFNMYTIKELFVTVYYKKKRFHKI